ncbi:hypothetical protein GCM10010260_07060 [Streptomyces filipinensis]|uniref:Uncharacterized protein n=1 Tax=Streptomyces filipinensis TaxID=66887 RepID=A0A918I600_9ACTN|nr:hypothetical protein [Streptomyces filipinensis]GGU77264.1 hypothetical protein GCM10010260_07060 [Streptomyces filipinensis]
MSDRTSDSGGRFTPPPDEDWTPEDDTAPGRRTAREPRPEERLPGEPPSPAATPSRRAGSTGPGREGLTADDRTPEDTSPHPPGPAGAGTAGRGTPDEEAPRTGPGSGARAETGSEGLRPGTEDLASGTGGAGGMPGEGRTTGGSGTVPESRTRGESGVRGQSPARRDDGLPGGTGLPGEGTMPDDGLGVPFPGETGAREASSTESPAPDTWPAAPAPGGRSGGVGERAPAPSGAAAPLLPHDETDHWERRMRQLAAGFVDEPRGAVEEADRALEEIVARFGEAVDRRRRTLRRSWEASEDRGPGSETDTEQLRLALRDYRELAGRLLHL